MLAGESLRREVEGENGRERVNGILVNCAQECRKVAGNEDTGAGGDLRSCMRTRADDEMIFQQREMTE